MQRVFGRRAGAPLNVPAFTHVEPFPGPADILAGDLPHFQQTLQEARVLVMRYQRQPTFPYQNFRPPDLATQKVMRGSAPSVPFMGGFPGSDFAGALLRPRYPQELGQRSHRRRTNGSLDGSLNRAQHFPFRPPIDSTSGPGRWAKRRQGEPLTTVRSDPFSRHAGASGAPERDPLQAVRTNRADAARGDYDFANEGAEADYKLRRQPQYPPAGELLLYPRHGPSPSNERGPRQSHSSASDMPWTDLPNGHFGAHPRMGPHVAGGGKERGPPFQAPGDGLQGRAPFHNHRPNSTAEGPLRRAFLKHKLAHDMQGGQAQREVSAAPDIAAMQRRQSPDELSELQDLSAWPALHSQSRPQRHVAQVPRWRAPGSEARELNWGPNLGSASSSGDLTEVHNEHPPTSVPLWPARGGLQTGSRDEAAPGALPWSSSRMTSSAFPSSAAAEAGPCESIDNALLGQPDCLLDQQFLDPARFRCGLKL